MKIHLSEKIGYGLGDMSSSMFWKLFGAYLMIFYTDVFGISAAVVGTMFAITRVWDSFFDPIVGVMADRTTSRWGHFRPYALSCFAIRVDWHIDFSDSSIWRDRKDSICLYYLCTNDDGLFGYQCALCLIVGSNES